MSARTAAAAAPRWKTWGIVFAVWVGYGLLSSLQHHLSYAMSRGITLPWLTSLRLEMPLALTWAAATPGIVWLGRTFRFERGRWPLSVVVHLAACLALVFVLDLSYAYNLYHTLPPAPPAPTVVQRAMQLIVVWAVADGLLYFTILSVAWAVERQQRLRERELAASQLETQLVEADLQALKMQLHPHFLFNALHTIGALVRTGDRDGAIRVVAGLGDLLRRLLDGASQQEVPLRQELDFISSYLDVEQVRFRDRLRVELDVEPGALDAAVPHLILQPLVENAIRHGIAPHREAGRLTVRAHCVGDRLELEVRDDGPGPMRVPGASARPGIGLANTRARLERLYDGAFELEARNAEGGGHVARVVVPLRMTAPARRVGVA